MNTTRFCTLLTLLTVLALVAGPASATPVTLTNGNATATIDPLSSAGMDSWTVNGVNQLYQQWFWYRIGSTGGEQPINNLATPTVSPSGGGGRSVDLTYAGTGLTVEIMYTLTGGPAGQYTSDIAESIDITNTSGTSEALHFFQYSDFDLNGTTGGQTVQITNPNTVDQWDGTSHLSETTINPTASEWAVALYASQLNSLSDNAPTTLGDVSGPVTGDATFAFEWDATLGAGQSLIISKDKRLSSVVPEPATILGLGTLLLFVGRKLQKRLA